MPILAKLAYGEGMNTNTLLVLRFSMAALGMWAVWATLYARGARVTVPRSALLAIIALGALGYVGQSFSYFTAVSLIPASFTGLLLYTYPILVTLLARLFFGESLTTPKLIALALGGLGALLVLGLGSQLIGGSQPLPPLNPEGVAWGLAAPIIYSVYIIAGTRFTAHTHPVFASAVIISSAALVYVIWGVSAGRISANFTPTGLLWAFLIAAVSTVFAISTFFAGLRVVGPSKAAILSTVEPAVTVLLAAWVLNETLAVEQVIGGMFIVASVFVLQLKAS
jgi:drug/metabolite transporter (DMT)-like permease